MTESRPEAPRKAGGRLLFRLLLAVVIVSPLPLGSNRPWAWSLLGLLTGLLLLAWSVAVARRRLAVSFAPRRLLLPGLPFAAALAWAAVQASGLTPESWWHPLWIEARNTLGAPVHGGISLDPTLTLTALFRLLTYGGVFWLAVQLCHDRHRARLALLSLAVANAAYATYGLVIQLAGLKTILWFHKWAYPDDLTGTFVGRNAAGAYAGIGAIIMLALLLHSLRRRHRPSIRDLDSTARQVLLALSGLTLSGLAVVLSHARGAFASAVVAALTLLVLAAVARMIRVRTLLLLLPLLLLGGAVLVLSGGEPLLERLLATDVHDARQALYRLTLSGISDSPWAGHGLGAFLPVFRIYRDSSLSSPLIWDYAHNIYLEAALDLGIAGAVLLYAPVIIAAGTCLWGLRARHRDHVYPLTALAVTTLLAVHGMTDFTAQIPAIAVTLSFILGLGYAQSWPGERHGQA